MKQKAVSKGFTDYCLGLKLQFHVPNVCVSFTVAVKFAELLRC